MRDQETVDRNIRVHRRLGAEYDELHGEIFNPIEQARLREKLKQAIAAITTDAPEKLALDYGCGTGNVTRHLADLGLRVTAADVTEGFLRVVQHRYGPTGRVETLRVNGMDLSGVPDNRFDLVATYSVLHHVPHYLRIVEEFARVVRRGGVIYLDHEPQEVFWNRTPLYLEYLRRARALGWHWRDFWRKVRRFLVNFPHVLEGDVHVHADDHVEWDRIESLLAARECESVIKEDYLLYVGGYRQSAYEAYKEKCQDTRVLIARKG